MDQDSNRTEVRTPIGVGQLMCVRTAIEDRLGHLDSRQDRTHWLIWCQDNRGQVRTYWSRTEIQWVRAVIGQQPS